tara:strand:- start:2362 stop:5541 length:3180 start_codon:yes stop_codon:yes gene_type:complete
MATLKDIQDAIDNKTFDPSKLTLGQKRVVNEAIRRGLIKGPTTSQLELQRGSAAKDVAIMSAAEKDPIGTQLQLEDSAIKGRNSAILGGDITGSITPYVLMRKKIFSAAKSKVPGNKNTGLFARTNYFKNAANNLTQRLPGRYKLFGGAMQLLAKVADPTVGRLLKSPLGRAEVYSVLGGTAGAGAGSITYDVLNETAGVQVMDAIADDLGNMPPREVNTDITANALDATFTALAWNAGAATLTPLILKSFGKVGRLAIGAKSKDAKQLVNIARDKGLPIPLVMTAREGVGLLGGFSNKFFKVLGIMPFVNGIGREALQGAEQAAGKQYLNTSVLNYGPLIKTGMLSSVLFKQADEAFKQNSALINSSYAGFESLANVIGNPRLIPTEKTKKFAKEMVDELAMSFPGIREYAEDKLGKIDINELQKLAGTADPLALFYRYVNQIGDFVTPKEYKGLIGQLNAAIEKTAYQNIRPQLWTIREALENDLNSFGGKITKENFLKDEGIKAAYDGAVKTQGKEAAELELSKKLNEAKKLRDKLYNANDTFSSIMDFYQRANITKVFKQFDNTKFTNKALAGIRGLEKDKPGNFFKALANDVFTNGTPESIDQLRKILGATAITSRKTGQAIGITKGGGEALYNAAKAKWMFNAFYKGFDSSLTPGGRTMMDEILEESTVKAGVDGVTDAMQGMVNVATRQGEEILDFSITKAKSSGGILDATKIKFSPRDTQQFNINRFLRILGIADVENDLAKDRLVKILGGPQAAKPFEEFITYMKAISDTPIADTSTFMQRRLQLGGLNSFAGAVVLGGSAAINPFAPALFVLLARRAGQILTDPIAMKAWNDALNPSEQIGLLMGKKVGQGVPGLLGIGRRYFKGRDIQTAANILKSPGVVGRLGLTQKREAFARVMNYLNDSDSDVPRIDPKNVTPQEITERLLQLDSKVPEPAYDQRTLPKNTYETLMAYESAEPSGNIDVDNNAVTFLQRSAQNEVADEVETAEVEAEDEQSIMDDIELENPVLSQNNQLPGSLPVPGQDVNPQTVKALFPFDTTLAAAADRRGRG